MDEADLGNAQAELNLSRAMAAITTKPEAEANGYCLNCGSPVEEGLRWCPPISPGADGCREDWEYMRKRH